MCTPTQGVRQPAGCVSCELVCVCVSLVRVVIICPASTHTALVSSPSLTVIHLPTYIHTNCEQVGAAAPEHGAAGACCTAPRPGGRRRTRMAVTDRDELCGKSLSVYICRDCP